MQSALNLNEDTKLISAERLKELTISKEELFERQKNGVIDSIMSSMVRQATEAGNTSYTATLNPQFDPKLLSSVTETLEGLGYKIETKAETIEKVGNVVALTVSWT